MKAKIKTFQKAFLSGLIKWWPVLATRRFPLTLTLSLGERFHGLRKTAICVLEPGRSAGHRPGQSVFSFCHEPSRCSAFRFMGREQPLPVQVGGEPGSRRQSWLR